MVFDIGRLPHTPPPLQPSVHHSLGLLATTLDLDEAADEHFAAAVDAHRALGAPLHEAESLVAWGRATGDEARLDEARHLATALGAEGLVA